MPLPKPRNNENRKAFNDRCMGNSVMNKEYTENNQRYAVCNSLWTRSKKDSEEQDRLIKDKFSKTIKEKEVIGFYEYRRMNENQIT